MEDPYKISGSNNTSGQPPIVSGGQPIFSSPEVPVPASNSGSNIMFTGGIAPKPKRKVLIISIIAGLIVVILIVFLSLLLPIFSRPYPDGMPEADVAKILTDENIETVNKLEQSMLNSLAEPMYVSAGTSQGQYDEAVSILTNELSVYKNIYTEIAHYEAIQYRADTVQFFTAAKTKMAKMIPLYETIINNIGLLGEVLSGNASINSLSSLYGFNNAVRVDLENYLAFVELNSEYQALNCTILQRTAPGTTCYNTRERLRELEAAASGTVDFRSIIIGDDPRNVNFIDNFVRKDLRAIQYAPEGKTVETDTDE